MSLFTRRAYKAGYDEARREVMFMLRYYPNGCDVEVLAAVETIIDRSVERYVPKPEEPEEKSSCLDDVVSALVHLGANKRRARDAALLAIKCDGNFDRMFMAAQRELRRL